jgi:hypothetical protein
MADVQPSFGLCGPADEGNAVGKTGHGRTGSVIAFSPNLTRPDGPGCMGRRHVLKATSRGGSDTAELPFPNSRPKCATSHSLADGHQAPQPTMEVICEISAPSNTPFSSQCSES